MEQLPIWDMRHLYKYLDGETIASKSYLNDIKKQLRFEKQPVVDWIEGNLSELLCILPDLSTDQKLLLEICMAIFSGSCSKDLTNRNSGKLSNPK